MNEWEKMTTGRLYNPTDSEIEKRHVVGMVRCEKFNRISLRRKGAKRRALEKLIPSAKGKAIGVFSPLYCEYGVNITVGENCFINYGCTFLDVAPVTLGDGVFVGANVTFATPNHPLLAEERLPASYPDGWYDLEYSAPITVEEGCWICSSATICGGVTIGKNSVIAAGAVVTKSVPPNSLVAGVPARVVRKLDENDRIGVRQTYEEDSIPLSQRKRL